MYLVPRVLRHAQETEACGTLLVPKWPSAPFWPMIFNNEGKSTLPGLLATEEIDKSQVIIWSGCNLFKGKPNTNLLAIRLEFNKTKGGIGETN